MKDPHVYGPKPKHFCFVLHRAGKALIPYYISLLPGEPVGRFLLTFSVTPEASLFPLLRYQFCAEWPFRRAACCLVAKQTNKVADIILSKYNAIVHFVTNPNFLHRAESVFFSNPAKIVLL